MSEAAGAGIVAAPPRTTLHQLRPSPEQHAEQPAAAPAPRAADVATWAALAIVAVGIAMRVYTIFAFDWDQDELYTITEARDLFHTTLPPGIDARPLYFLLQHPLLALLPQTRVMLRVLPLIFGAAGLWTTWLIGRRHVGRVGGLVAVFLASASIWHMEISGQARYYSLVYLCVSLVLLWLPDAEDAESPSRYLAVCAAMALGTLTHPSFVFPVAGITLGALVMSREGKVRMPWPTPTAWRWLWGPFIGFLAVFALALRLAHRESALRNSVGRGDAASARLLPAMVEWMTPVVFGAAMVAVVFLLLSRGAGRRRLGIIVLLSLAVTFGALLAMSRWTAVYAIYGTGVLPTVFVAAGVLAQMIADREPARELQVAAGALALLGFAVAPSALSHLSDGTRFDYRPAFSQIQREQPARPVVAWPAVIAEADAPTLTILPYYPTQAYFESLRARYGDFWFVASVKRAGIALDDDGTIDQWLSTNCRRRGVYQRPRFDYRLYRVELYRCGAPAAQGSAALH